VINLKNRKLVVIAAVAALIVSAGACKKQGSGPAAAAGGRGRIQFPVDVEQVPVRSLVYTVSAVGSVEAFEKVQVTARVSGAVDRVLFSEGEYAAAGQTLAMLGAMVRREQKAELSGPVGIAQACTPAA